MKAHHRLEASAMHARHRRPRQSAIADVGVLCSVTQAEAIAARMLEEADERRRQAGLVRSRPVTIRRFSWEDPA